VIDIYVRVSQVAGREGDSFQSPAEQEKRCRAQLDALGLEAGRVFTDLDQSGGKMRRPEFDKLMARIESGASGGIVVSKLNRFSRLRSAVDAVLDIEKLGAKFISVEPAIDTSSVTGRFMLSVFAALSQMELEQLTEQWETAQANFLARDGYGGAFTPTGYDRDEGGRLIPNADAPAIKQAFQLRAQGKTLKEVGKFMSEQGVKIRAHGKPGKDGKRFREEHTDWRETGVTNVLSNEVYLGVGKAGGKRKQGAHPAIVTRAEFEKAQAQHAPGRVQNGERSEGGLLTGLLFCASCGGVLTHDGRGYRCNSRSRTSVNCTRRVYIANTTVAPFVEARMLEFLGALDFDTSTGKKGPSAARLAQAVTDAEAEVAAYLLHVPATTLGFAEGLAQRTARVDITKRALDNVTDTEDSWMFLSTEETQKFYEWMSLTDKRRVLAACVRRATVSPGRGTADQRVSIEFAPHPTVKAKRPAWLTAPITWPVDKL
jgi:DNA invertase Pin-like site-specific DNA recombinase